MSRPCLGPGNLPVVGLGQHQVTSKADRVARSVAVAIMAYLLLKLRAKHIRPDRLWSVFRLLAAFACEAMQGPCERSAHHIARK
jgi:hypothetical protein